MTKFEKLIKKSIIIDGKVTIGSILGLVDKLVDGCKDDPDIEIDNLKFHFVNEGDFKRKKSESPSGDWKICIELKVVGKSYTIIVNGGRNTIFGISTYEGTSRNLITLILDRHKYVRGTFMCPNYPDFFADDE